MPKHNQLVHVHVANRVNSSLIRHETRNGRKVIIVPSATLPDDIVMNGIKYPADEIAASYATLERAPAPAGHPVLNGVNVSAYDTEANNHYGIGAWNENVRQEGGRVLLDKVIDVERAKHSDKGNEVLNAIYRGEPIHTSTGLTARLDNAEDSSHEFVARDIVFDHDAILIHEQGAATPDQGVGMLVNGKEIEVINSTWEDDALDWAVKDAHRALESKANAPKMAQFKQAVVDAFSAIFGQSATTNSAEEGEADMAEDKRLEQLEATVGEIGQSVKELTAALPETIANAVAEAVKPTTELVANMKQEAADKEKAELDELVNKLVKAKLLDEEDRDAIQLNAARALAKNLPEKKGAVTVNGNSNDEQGSEDDLAGYDPNVVVKAFNKKEA